MPHADRSQRLQYNRDYYRRNRAEKLVYAKGHYADNADRIRGERLLKRDADSKRVASEKQRARYRALRAEVLATYGGACECCGERIAAFLELDHIDSSGASHRREIGRGSGMTYKWVKDRGYPRESFRLMCANCNQGRARNGGIFPHVSR